MSKLVALNIEAYERLSSKKIKNESFSDVVIRITGKSKLSTFAGILTEDEASLIESKIKKLRSTSKARLDSIKEKINDS